MSRLRAIAAAPGRLGRAIAGGIRAILEPLRPEPDTTEASVYFGLILLAIGFAVAGDEPLAFIVPGAIVTLLGSAPVIVGILRRGG